MSGKDFVNSELIRTMYEACDVITEAGGCNRCPLKNCCLDDSSFRTVCEEATVKQIDDFLGFSDDIEEHNNEDDMFSYYADTKRKADIEDASIWERYGY